MLPQDENGMREQLSMLKELYEDERQYSIQGKAALAQEKAALEAALVCVLPASASALHARLQNKLRHFRSSFFHFLKKGPCQLSSRLCPVLSALMLFCVLYTTHRPRS